MGQPVEVRIRPHHHDGDVIVGHVEFPEGDPGTAPGRKFVISQLASFDVPDSVPQRIAFDGANPSYSEGFGFENFGSGNVMQIPVEKGPYFIRLVPDWQFQGIPDGGYVQAQVIPVDADGSDRGFMAYNFHQYTPGNVQDVKSEPEMIYIPEDGWHLELEVSAGGVGETPNIAGSFQLFQL
jgi:hypothetical protein